MSVLCVYRSGGDRVDMRGRVVEGLFGKYVENSNYLVY